MYSFAVMDWLVHFLKYPPGLDGLVRQKIKALSPMSNDLSPEILSKISQRARDVYDNHNFVYLIPEDSMDSWKKSGQLDSLLGMIVGMNWFEKSIEKLVIDASNLDLSSALVRETFFISPDSLGGPDYKISEAKYTKAYVEMVESVQYFGDYKNDFKNPEILLPCKISFDLICRRELIG